MSQRQAAHAALSDVLVRQPDRRVWHRAAARLAPDEQVAAELDEAAARARRRGAIAVAIAAKERAAELSEDATRRGSRLLQAAEMAFELGRPSLSLRLLRAVEAFDLTADERTRLSWLRELSDEPRWSGEAKLGSFAETAERMRLDGHPDLALRLLVSVAMRCWWGKPDQEIRAAAFTRGRAPPPPPPQPRPPSP